VNVCEYKSHVTTAVTLVKHVARRDERANVLEDCRKLMAVEKIRANAVGIATRCGLDSPGIESCCR
jgi:predicted metal-dependent TIM-barrel fold hydrolase